MSSVVRIGTRGSPLALAQARGVQAMLGKASPGLSAELVVIRTTGDALAPENRAQTGTALKGLFVKEIEEALLERRIDLAVHSVKDLETAFPAGLILGAVLKREDPRDAWISRAGQGLWEMPAGSRVGVSSLRRLAQLKRARRDLEYLPIRGNVDTRLKKMDAGECDAVVLAGCGLIRLGWAERILEWLDPSVVLPAAGQGALGIEIRKDRTDLQEKLAALEDSASRSEVEAERSLLAALGGDCRVPVGALAKVQDDGLVMDGVVLSPDGLKTVRRRVTGPRTAARALGIELASHLRALGADRLLFGPWNKA